MTDLAFTIPGKPRGKPRHRMRVIWKNGAAVAITYPDPRGVKWEKEILDFFWLEFQTLPDPRPGMPWPGPVIVQIMAYFPYPSDKSKRWRDWAAENIVPAPTGQDTDNIAKLVLDALNTQIKHGQITRRGAWLDDRQIVTCLVSKFYAELPRTEVFIQFQDVIERPKLAVKQEQLF